MKRKWVIAGISVVAAGILIWLVGGYYVRQAIRESVHESFFRDAQTTVAVPGPAPDFLIYDLENQPVRFSDFQGKLLLINFWATWCPPCVEEIPHLQKLFQNYSKKGLVVLGISMDESDTKTVQTFVKKNEMTYPVAMIQKKLEKDFGGIRGIPTSFLIDRNGKIVKKWVGYRDYDFFKSLVESHL